jgi:hypothetical protein
VTGGWGELHGEELHNLYSSPNIIEMIKLNWIRMAVLECWRMFRDVSVIIKEWRIPAHSDIQAL